MTLAFTVPQPAWATEGGYAPVAPASASVRAEGLRAAQVVLSTCHGPYFYPQPKSLAILSPPQLASSRVFTVTAVIRMPPTAIRVRPGVAEELKHGWIQYVSFLVLTVIAGVSRRRAGLARRGRGCASPPPLDRASVILAHILAPRDPSLLAAWLLRVALFSFRLVETAVYVDAPRASAKAHVE